MPDEPKVDLQILAANIQKAMSAYSDLQTQIAAALQPYQEQWARLVAGIRPLQQQWVTAATELSAVQERWTSELGAIQDVVAQWGDNWAAAQAALAKVLAEAGPRLRQTLERADHVGHLGWTVTMSMTPPDMVRLSVLQEPEADAYMLHWYEARDPDLSRCESRILQVKELEPFYIPISQCLKAYRSGEIAITIPCLIAVLERGIRNLGPAKHFFSTKVEKTVKDLYSKAKEDDPDSIEVFVWVSLYAFIQWFYEGYGPKNVGEDRLFRNGIQHGTQAPPNEKIEALRLFHALDTVGELYP
jgi:hypothetical protein